MSKKENVVKQQDARYDVDELLSLEGKSAKIRYLTSKSLSRSEIVKVFNDVLGLQIRYQHVRNVQVTVLKKDM